jgi:hypothetical protein
MHDACSHAGTTVQPHTHTPYYWSPAGQTYRASRRPDPTPLNEIKPAALVLAFVAGRHRQLHALVAALGRRPVVAEV